MNKQGIVLDFLITVVLAIIIFVPAILIVSKFFSISTQAQESFKDLAKLMPKAQSAAQSTIVVMDKDTSIIGYTANKNTQLCMADGGCRTLSLYPAECGGESCLCLCQELQDTGFSSDPHNEAIVCKKRSCQKIGNINFKDYAKVSNFYITEDMLPNLANGYFRNGFTITRGTLDISGLRFHFQQLRRMAFTVVPEGNNEIGICKNIPCGYYK